MWPMFFQRSFWFNRVFFGVPCSTLFFCGCCSHLCTCWGGCVFSTIFAHAAVDFGGTNLDICQFQAQEKHVYLRLSKEQFLSQGSPLQQINFCFDAAFNLRGSVEISILFLFISYYLDLLGLICKISKIMRLRRCGMSCHIFFSLFWFPKLYHFASILIEIFGPQLSIPKPITKFYKFN